MIFRRGNVIVNFDNVFSARCYTHPARRYVIHFKSLGEIENYFEYDCEKERDEAFDRISFFLSRGMNVEL